jgi:anti-anti-sigma factor
MTLNEWNTVSVLEPEGDLYEGAECDEMERVLLPLAERGRRAVVDLSRARQLGAHGLGILAHAHDLAVHNGGRVVLCGARRAHRWLLARTRLAGVLPLFDTRALAIKDLEDSPRSV